jgi:Homeodomain-like domain
MNSRYNINYKSYAVVIMSGIHKKVAYEQAVAFRKRGFTYTEISKICDVSRGTVSNWLAKQAFSQVVAKQNGVQAAKDNKKRIALVNKARNTERALKYAEVLRYAETEYKHFRHSPLFVAGLAIYLAQGDHKDVHAIRLSTSKEDSQRLFVAFLREFMGVDDSSITFWLLLYPSHDPVRCMKRWSRALKLSVAHFGKYQTLTSGSQSEALHFGVGNTIIGSTLLKRKLLCWLELLKKETVT